METTAANEPGASTRLERGVDRWRQALAESTALWTHDGRFAIEQGWCAAFSGAPAASGNMLLCWGDDAAALCAKALGEVQESKLPALVLVAGPALAGVQVFADAKWVCAGTRPMMLLDLEDLAGGTDDQARPLAAEELGDAWEIAGDAYRIPPAVAGLSLPAAIGQPEIGTWGLFEDGRLRAVMATYRAGDVVGVWSVGTSRSDRRHGYAQRLTCSVLSHLRAAGATHAVLLASIPGGPLYRNVGFEVVDDWQMWSRPRWVLGRV